MNLNNLNKKQSGIIFLIVYGFSFVAGLIIFFILRFRTGVIITFLVADVVMTVIVFIVGYVIKNASLYDPYWSVIPPFFTIIWALQWHGFTLPINVILVLIAVLFWSIRLTYNWWKNWTGFSEQDWRYDMLREKNPKLYPITNFFGIHMIPTLVVFLQMICVFAFITSFSTTIVSVIGFIIAIAAPIIQFISDKQMYEFRVKNEEKSKVINSGLWRFTRHPNYFGELLFWVGIYVMYLGMVKRIDVYILFPFAMIALFIFISIPMMENKLIKRPGYEEYKKQVSMIIPFFPKKVENNNEIIEEKA